MLGLLLAIVVIITRTIATALPSLMLPNINDCIGLYVCLCQSCGLGSRAYCDIDLGSGTGIYVSCILLVLKTRFTDTKK